MKTVEKIITDAVDTTFMQRGFKASRHTEAILKALKEEGYVIVYRPHEPSNEVTSENP